MMSDNVKHPSHYAEGRKFEPKDVIRDWGLNFNMGNAVKYLSRAGRKGDKVEDLQKAQQYIQFELEALGAKRTAPVTPQPSRSAVEPKKAEEVLPTVTDLLSGGVEEFLYTYCKKGLHGCMMRKFKAGSKVYFITSVRVEDEGVIKKVILRLTESGRQVAWVNIGNLPVLAKNTIEITLEG